MQNSETKLHYDNLLGNIYSWMSGDLYEKQKAFMAFLEREEIIPRSTGVAIDLGAAHGIQSLALARRGFSVRAIDFNHQLLEELAGNAKGMKIEPINDDLRKVKKYADSDPELIICWGDTITHLESKEEIGRLISDCHDSLTGSGRLLISFRDNSTEAPGTQKIIQVKDDSTRSLTCKLEYGTNKVKVTDELKHFTENGWQQQISSYHKVRISQTELEALLTSAGFAIASNETVAGFASVVAVK